MNDNFLTQLHCQPLGTVTDYYATCLAANTAALEYLTCNALLPERDTDQAIGSLTDSEEPDASALRLTVGFAGRTLGNHIPKGIVKVGKALRAELTTHGVYRSNGREHFRGMVTGPVGATHPTNHLAVGATRVALPCWLCGRFAWRCYSLKLEASEPWDP